MERLRPPDRVEMGGVEGVRRLPMIEGLLQRRPTRDRIRQHLADQTAISLHAGLGFLVSSMRGACLSEMIREGVAVHQMCRLKSLSLWGQRNTRPSGVR